VVGDTLTIDIEKGAVLYQKNGVTFYQSSKLPSYPLAASVVLFSIQSTASNVMLGVGSTGTTSLRSTSDTVGTAVARTVGAVNRGSGSSH
ncbi:MAG: hypothetical protein ACREFP_20600, partial [Acetobacteraceae bacterium]